MRQTIPADLRISPATSAHYRALIAQEHAVAEWRDICYRIRASILPATLAGVGLSILVFLVNL